MKWYIKYMVSLRCKMMVEQLLSKIGIGISSIELGVIDTYLPLSQKQHDELSAGLRTLGLELLEDKKNILIEKVKNVIIDMIHHSEELPQENYSVFISEKMGYDYAYISGIFSEVKGITIQQFIILHKIERVKELLLYNEQTLTEIAYMMHYSSVAHLSNQFKKTTGLTPTFYKRIKRRREQNLENL
ncbi:AraC family transcriptional regulator [Rurimicrobium arvi]